MFMRLARCYVLHYCHNLLVDVYEMKLVVFGPSLCVEPSNC